LSVSNEADEISSPWRTLGVDIHRLNSQQGPFSIRHSSVTSNVLDHSMFGWCWQRWTIVS